MTCQGAQRVRDAPIIAAGRVRGAFPWHGQADPGGAHYRGFELVAPLFGLETSWGVLAELLERS